MLWVQFILGYFVNKLHAAICLGLRFMKSIQQIPRGGIFALVAQLREKHRQKRLDSDKFKTTFLTRGKVVSLWIFSKKLSTCTIFELPCRGRIARSSDMPWHIVASSDHL
jgi:hypothetical protein